jgi:hypothetical protein
VTIPPNRIWNLRAVDFGAAPFQRVYVGVRGKRYNEVNELIDTRELGPYELRSNQNMQLECYRIYDGARQFVNTFEVDCVV